MTTDQGGLWEWYSTPALQWKGSRKRNIRRSWQRSSIRKEGFDWSWSRNVQINICEFVEIEAGSDSLHLHLAFASSCCLFVRLIISDFLLRLLVFVGSPSHISSAAFSHPGQSGKATTSAADALRDRTSFGFFFSDWGTGCAWVRLAPDWSNTLLSPLWLVRSGSGGRSWGVGVGDLARGQDAAYLCLHSHRQPAQVLTLGGDY